MKNKKFSVGLALVTALVLLLGLFSSNCYGAYGRRYYVINFVDEWGEPVTSITSFSCYISTTSTAVSLRRTISFLSGTNGLPM